MKILRKLIQLLPKFGNKNTKTKRFIDDFEFNSLKKLKEDETNRILEKISKKGINSLTKSELDFLEN